MKQYALVCEVPFWTAAYFQVYTLVRKRGNPRPCETDKATLTSLRNYRTAHVRAYANARCEPERAALELQTEQSNTIKQQCQEASLALRFSTVNESYRSVNGSSVRLTCVRRIQAREALGEPCVEELSVLDSPNSTK